MYTKLIVDALDVQYFDKAFYTNVLLQLYNHLCPI